MSGLFDHETFYNKDEKIWYGKKEAVNFTEQDSIGSIALQRLLDCPDLTAQICFQTGRSITYREMTELTVQVARSLEFLQLQQGDVIGMNVCNSDYMTPVLLGSLMTGCCISTLDPSFDVEGIKHIYSKTRPKIMFCDGDNYGKVKQAFDECGLSSATIITVHQHMEGIPSVLEFFKKPANVEDYRVSILKHGVHQTALILCSSGTTGPPKCVQISHAAIISDAFKNSTTNQVYLCFSSLYWLSGVLSIFHSIKQGTRIISQKPFDPRDFFDIVQQYKVNIVLGPPSHLAQALASEGMAKSDLSSIRAYICGGASLPYSLVEKFQRYAPDIIILAPYTTTEITSLVAMDVCVEDGSLGYLALNIEVKIISEDGNKLGPMCKGEICVRTPLPWAGYINNPEATRAAYDKDNWHHTGDVGYFNYKGQLYIVDRIKDILKYNNYHFSPSIIENVINEIPGVCTACVVGIPNVNFGYLPAAAVIRLPGSNVSAVEITQHVKDRMQHFEQLRGGVFFMESLPCTVTGKVMRREVLKICEKLFHKQIKAKM